MTAHFAMPRLDQPIASWDRRWHEAPGSLCGAERSYDEHGVNAFQAARLGRLLDLFDALAEPAAPLRILDAGCGNGWAGRALASWGHQVDGIDTSPTAIESCRARAGADRRESYAQGRLDAWAPGYLYDAVLSLDVLSHIIQDADWELSLGNLACLLRVGGRLVLSEHDLQHDHAWDGQTLSRARRCYDELLQANGMRYVQFTPCRFRDNAAGFHVFARVA